MSKSYLNFILITAVNANKISEFHSSLLQPYLFANNFTATIADVVKSIEYQSDASVLQ